MTTFRQADRLKNNYLPIAIAKGRIIINFCQGVWSDRGIIARMSLIVRNLVKQGFWQYANLANTLLGVIWGKVLAIAPKWGDIPKVDPQCVVRQA
ncbi:MULTISPECIES: hypothetical protein [Microcystis]|uniref:hypothetical protein n=1 Tax=Microcystis TaxID=1125 RepID=UPI001EDEB525|nr:MULTISPECIES: hypothetical protein [Microcystis]WNF15747.1 hypothetical protein RKE53_04840 [Microcystis aeruginosa NRERC-214]